MSAKSSILSIFAASLLLALIIPFSVLASEPFEPSNSAIISESETASLSVSNANRPDELPVSSREEKPLESLPEESGATSTSSEANFTSSIPEESSSQSEPESVPEESLLESMPDIASVPSPQEFFYDNVSALRQNSDLFLYFVVPISAAVFLIWKFCHWFYSTFIDHSI